jgi:carbamoylphosphate synthase large subunit
MQQIKDHTKKIALGLRTVGLNLQFAIKDEIVYIIEANPRASRTVPLRKHTENICKLCDESNVGSQ